MIGASDAEIVGYNQTDSETFGGRVHGIENSITGGAAAGYEKQSWTGVDLIGIASSGSMIKVCVAHPDRPWTAVGRIWWKDKRPVKTDIANVGNVPLNKVLIKPFFRKFQILTLRFVLSTEASHTLDVWCL